MAEIKRITKRFGISPIGVMRVPESGENIGSIVRESADKIRGLAFESAKEKAIDSGELQAAELSLSEIRNIDPNTKEPLAAASMEDMGKFRRDAFERILLKRFENTLTDQINAKAKELAQKVSVEHNAPSLFDQAFDSYLNTIGENTSGFYKQVITDVGSRATVETKNLLQLQEIQRMQSEVKLAKERLNEDLLKDAYDAGASSEHADFWEFNNKIRIATDEYQDLFDVGGTTLEERDEVVKFARIEFIKGRLSTVLKDPNVAEYSELIHAYFATGGNREHLLSLPPIAQNAIREIRSFSTGLKPSDFKQLAKDTTGEFNAAITVGENHKANRSAEQAADEQLFKDKAIGQANSSIFDLENGLETAELIGATQSTESILAFHDSLRRKLIQNEQNRPIIGDTKANKLNDLINKTILKSSLGLANQLLRPREGQTHPASGEKLTIAPLSKGQLKTLSDGIGDEFLMAEIIPKDHWNLYGSLISTNPEPFKNLFSGAHKIEVTKDDKRKIELSNSLSRSAAVVDGILTSDTSTVEDATKALEKFKNDFGGNKIIEKEFIEKVRQLGLKLIEKENKENERTYKNNVDSIKSFYINFQNNVDMPRTISADFYSIFREAEKYNLGDDKVRADLQNIFDIIILRSVRDGMFNLSDNPVLRKSQISNVIQVFAKQESFDNLSEQEQKYYNFIKGYHNAVQNADKGNLPINIGAKALDVVNDLSIDYKKLNTALNSEIDQIQKNIVSNEAAKKLVDIGESLRDGNPLPFGATPEDALKAAEQIFGININESLYFKTERDVSENQFLAWSKNHEHYVNLAFVKATKQVLNGSRSNNNVNEWYTHLHQEAFDRRDGRLRIKPAYLNSGKFSDQEIGQILSLMHVESFAPMYSGGLGTLVNDIVNLKSEVMTKEYFKELTGEENAIALLMNDGSVDPELIPVLAPALEVAIRASFLTKVNYEDWMHEVIESEYEADPNQYNYFTGTHHSNMAISRYLTPDQMELFSAFIKKKVLEANILADNDVTRDMSERALVFNNDGVSISDLRKDEMSYILRTFADLGANVTNAYSQLSQADRAHYGPSSSSTRSNPVWSLWRVRPDLSVEEVVGSQFSLNEIIQALPDLEVTPMSEVEDDLGDLTTDEQAEIDNDLTSRFGLEQVKQFKDNYGEDWRGYIEASGEEQFTEDEVAKINEYNNSTKSDPIKQRMGETFDQFKDRVRHILKPLFGNDSSSDEVRTPNQIIRSLDLTNQTKQQLFKLNNALKEHNAKNAQNKIEPKQNESAIDFLNRTKDIWLIRTRFGSVEELPDEFINAVEEIIAEGKN